MTTRKVKLWTENTSQHHRQNLRRKLSSYGDQEKFQRDGTRTLSRFEKKNPFRENLKGNRYIFASKFTLKNIQINMPRIKN